MIIRTKEEKIYRRRWFKITAIVVLLVVIVGGTIAWKAGFTLSKISLKGNLFSSILRSIPGVENKLKGEEEGRINVLLLGMRGENIPGGGLLADTIMVVSVKPEENKVAIMSIPRDLYVDVPGQGFKSKINSVHHYGEEKGKGQGLADMEEVIGQVVGGPIHYAVSTNFSGFVELVDAIGGIDITLEQPFSEPMQFQEEHVCDPNVFTVPTGNYEIKRNEKGKIVAKYPLCLNKERECGGNFTLPAGHNHLGGQTALCYVRSRVSSNDFERAKRQQFVLKSIKEKVLSVGTLTDFSKVDGILNALGDNVRTDMEPWEMKRFFDIYRQMSNPEIYQRVLESTEEGLLYSPPIDSPEAGYILLPRAGDYSQIQDMFDNIFSLPPQSDIKPK